MYRVLFHKLRRLDDFDSAPIAYIKDEHSRLNSVRVMKTLKHPFTYMISGQSGFGKTYFCFGFLPN